LLYTGPAVELEWLAGVLRQGLGLSIPGAPAGAGIGAVARGPLPAARRHDAAEPRQGLWLFAALLGAVCGDVAWIAFHVRDLMAGPVWLLFYIVPWVASGAALGIGCAALYRAHQWREVRRLGAVSRPMNLALQPVASREDLGDFFYLRLFRHWSSARNRLTGIIDGVPVDMLDCTIRSHSETVLLLPTPEWGVLPFDLRPRDYLEMFFGVGLADETGTMVKPEKGQPRRVRECIERFRLQYEVRRYYLSEHFEEAADWAALKSSIGALFRSALRPKHFEEAAASAALNNADSGLGPDRAGTEEDIRQFFNLDLLVFFADHPGWHIETDGQHLALWRPYRTIRAARRPCFVAEALKVYRALARAAAIMAPRSSQAVQETGARPSTSGQFEKEGASAWRRLQS
jgi:hypothetical protein